MNTVKQTSNEVIDQQKGVDVGEVDAVGGAKPEPEERTFHERMVLRPDEVKLSNGQTIQGQKMAQTVETPVADIIESYGKQCGRCKFWNHQQGQTELARINAVGTPEERRALHQVRALFIEGDEMVLADKLNDLDAEADKVFLRFGKCTKLTDLHPIKEAQLVMPEQETCPSELPWISGPIPFMYEAKDGDVEAHDKMMFDTLMFTAARK